jgi:5-carboxymethyl-2-hydroxymuconate isomerase
MPHLVIETTPTLGGLLDFPMVLQALHLALAASGDARLEDLKSRVHKTEIALAGNDPHAQFIVIRLMTTNPRPLAVEHRMVATIHAAFNDAVAQLELETSWQCCVLIERIAIGDYLKSGNRHALAEAAL